MFVHNQINNRGNNYKIIILFDNNFENNWKFETNWIVVSSLIRFNKKYNMIKFLNNLFFFQKLNKK